MEELAGGASGTQIPLRRSKRVAAAAVVAGDHSGAQIPFRRNRAAKRPRSSSAQIQSRGLKRKFFFSASSMSQASPSWGAKRARSALGLGGGGKPAAAASGRPLPPSPNDGSCADLLGFRRELSWGAKRERGALAAGGANNSGDPRTARDWANLGDGPAGLVAELALAGDVADYIRFRAVCRPWRRCSPDPRRLDDRFLPRRWIMLDKAFAGPRCRRFLNLSTGESIRMDLPELAAHRLLALTPDGLLLLLDRDTFVLRLLNPLTRHLADLPPVTTLLTPEQLEVAALEHEGRDTVQVRGVGLVAGASAVAVSFVWPPALAVAKPGDESWTLIHKSGVISALPFEGRFYCATSKGVMVLNITSDQQQQPPRLQMVAERGSLFYSSSMTDSLHLVDNSGELMLLHQMIRWIEDTGGRRRRRSHERRHAVYRVDLGAGILVPVRSFNGRAVFTGSTRAISVSPETFPYVAADTIYLGCDCDGDTLSYRLADGRRERCHRHTPRTFLSPCSIVGCLCYCIQGVGTKLA